MTARQIEHPAADVLRVLAVSRSSGALEIRGPRGGTLFLYKGDLTYAEAPGVPELMESGSADPRLTAAIRDSMVEAGLALLTGPIPATERPLFRPGRQHWTGLRCRVGVEDLLDEIADQVEVFAELGVDPDNEVRLCELPAGRTAILSREQWALAAEMSGRQTARSLAWRLGAHFAATVSNLAALLGAGVVQFGAPVLTRPDLTSPASVTPVSGMLPVRHASQIPSPPSGSGPSGTVVSAAVTPAPVAPAAVLPAVVARASVAPAAVTPPVPRVNPRTTQWMSPQAPTEERLAHRVRGASSLPAALEASAPTPASADPDLDGARELALRLLAGLRRL